MDENMKCPNCGSCDTIKNDGEEGEDGIAEYDYLCGHCGHAWSGHWSIIDERSCPQGSTLALKPELNTVGVSVAQFDGTPEKVPGARCNRRYRVSDHRR